MEDLLIQRLYACQDTGYQAFQQKLLPTLAPSCIIGVRTPVLRRLAKELAEDGGADAFLATLPHTYFEENQLHGFLVSGMADFPACLASLERFLPYIDNWATCDQTSPKLFKQHKQALLPHIYQWLRSDHPYTVRFAIGMLMQHFLDGDFHASYLETVAGIQSDEYYVNLEIAWYMATALAKQWDAALPYLEDHRLGPWVHARAIQKARESRRLTDWQKERLKQLAKSSGKPSDAMIQ